MTVRYMAHLSNNELVLTLFSDVSVSIFERLNTSNVDRNAESLVKYVTLHIGFAQINIGGKPICRAVVHVKLNITKS